MLAIPKLDPLDLVNNSDRKTTAFLFLASGRSANSSSSDDLQSCYLARCDVEQTPLDLESCNHSRLV